MGYQDAFASRSLLWLDDNKSAACCQQACCRHSRGMNSWATPFSQPVNCIFWPIETLNWFVAASKLHKRRGTCYTVGWPYCPFAILCCRAGARALIVGGGYMFIYSDSARLVSFEINLTSKERADARTLIGGGGCIFISQYRE